MRHTKATRPTAAPLPTAVKTDSRICFGIAYFATEAEADRYALHVRQRGDTYNGGYFHGMACGREPHRDYDQDGRRLYAVTTR